ncbi:isochorismate synthase MenF [Roseibium sp. RKSG952]|uniref:isochorismate synthase n=1 Tax=Roseibium sp. RKSG952 TaxID=2529384 RepID=UPI0012BC0D84|nr:isochorismate synthase [Roseibium sp. RKSG952]MTH96590.1 isochorismate synthase [Roseibium sp. RKSG952]
MTIGACIAFDEDVIPHPESADSFLFSSGNFELHAKGIRERIALPVRGGNAVSGLFHEAVGEALERARKAGQENPIVVGAIPFDLNEVSCLYVPDSYAWQERRDGQSVPSPQSGMPDLLDQKSIPDESGFKRAVRHAIVNFQHSDVQKAVLSVTRELQFSGPVDVNSLLNSLRAQNRDGYQFQVPLPDGTELIGVSPELLLRKTGQDFVSNPLAGSTKRRADPQADKEAAGTLLQSGKDRYEHRLVVEDIERILSPHCSEITVPDAPSLLSTSALWHLSTVIEGQLADTSISALQLANMLHPTPAVCGYPTELAHRLIRFVEPFERGLFTGIVGWCDAEGNGEWVITIRCGIVAGDKIRLFAGAGIVEASEPDSEWNEVQTKLGTMLNACGIAA